MNIEYLPKDFYYLNIKIMKTIVWISQKRSFEPEIDTDRYVYKIFEIIYLADTPEFRDALAKSKMWGNLNATV